jgi:hypothetical protein
MQGGYGAMPPWLMYCSLSPPKPVGLDPPNFRRHTQIGCGTVIAKKIGGKNIRKNFRIFFLNFFFEKRGWLAEICKSDPRVFKNCNNAIIINFTPPARPGPPQIL